MRKKPRKFKSIFLILVILILFQIFNNPEHSIKSAREGLYLWGNLLLPSLFPFFIISNLLISLDLMNIIGGFLEPLMRLVFNLPGISIFPLSISMISGYPVGAKLVSDFRKKKFITKSVGDKLISFSSTSGPLFLLGTVLIGMLSRPDLGLLILLPHYLGAITLGILSRFIRKSDSQEILKPYNYERNEESMGVIIASSIKDSIDSILMIGGFVIIYSVIINGIFETEIFNLIVKYISQFTRIDSEIIKGISAGIIELTNGCRIISGLNIKLIEKILIINFLIGWGGLSIHSQALSFINSTDLNPTIYIVSKFFHGLLTYVYTLLIYKIKYKGILDKSVVYMQEINTLFSTNWIELLVYSTKISILFMIYILIATILLKKSKPKF